MVTALIHNRGFKTLVPKPRYVSEGLSLSETHFCLSDRPEHNELHIAIAFYYHHVSTG